MEIDWGNLKVLVADDQRFMINIVIRVLKELGVQVDHIHQATSGTDAVAVLGKNPVDIVLCDINMGPGNGLKLLQRIRTGSTHAPAETPLVFITGHSDEQTVRAAIGLDANGFIIKPISINSLRAKVSHALAARPQSKDPRRYASVPTSLSRSVQESAALNGNAHVECGPERKSAPPESASEADSEQISLDQVKEDDLLAEDIISIDGAVLVKSGTRLSNEMISQLKAHAQHLSETRFTVSRNPSGHKRETNGQ